MSIVELTEWIQMSSMPSALRESAYAYPIIEGTHVLSLALAVGTIIWFDLRLVGLILRGQSIANMYASLRPWIFLGFSLMLVTGVLLFLARAADVWQSTYFRIKIVLLLLCLANVLIYHFVVGKDSANWNNGEVAPAAARLAGGISLVLWFSVIAVGRIMAYNL